MTHSDPKRQFAVEVVRRLKEAGFQALWAGGCVRDFLMGREPKDYDVATDAVPEQVRQLFGRRRTIPVGESFGVIIVPGPEKQAGQVEVATFRTDLDYADGRRPTGVVFSTPAEDARRRDFTINGMFYDPVEARVLDFVGGEEDLSRAVVRAIGDPHDRMREDKLRMLRAVRFAATLDFQLDPATADAIREMAPELTVVSVERIAQELKKMLVEPHRTRAMQLTREVGLLPVIFPELAAALERAPGEWDVTLHMLQLLPEPGFELAAAALWHAVAPPDDGTPVSAQRTAEAAFELGKRLRLSNQEIEHICWLLAHRHDLRNAPSLPLSRLKRIMAHPLIGDLMQLNRAEAIARNQDLTSVAFCEEFLRQTPPEEIDPPPLIGGNDLIALGVPPGPRFRELLEAVRDAQFNGEIRTQDEALELAKLLLHETDGDKK